MSIGIADILATVASKAMETALFEQVLTHEPKSAPGGPSVAIFVSGLKPFRQRSGLATVSVALTLTVRIYANMLQDPQDDIDRDMVILTDTLVTSYVSDFDLGSETRQVDVFGENGDPLSVKPGYIEQDRVLYRIMEITLPIIISDVWTEAA